MHRRLSTVAVLTLLLCAVVICVWQTIELRETLTENIASALIAVEVLVGAVIVATCASLLRDRFADANPKRTRFEGVQQLLRIFSAVWS